LTAHLRPLVERGTGSQRRAFAFMAALKPPYHQDASASGS